MKKISLERYDGYRAAKLRLNELQRDLRAAEGEKIRLETRIADGRVGSDLATEAAALLAGKAFKETAINAAEQENLGKLRHRIAVLREAISQQQRIVDDERGRASAVICAEVKDEHCRVVRDLALAVIAFGRAADIERAFRDELEAADVEFAGYLRFMAFSAAGDPRDPNGRLSAYLREAAVHGFIGRGDIPAEWLAHWGSWLDSEIKERRAAAQPVPAPRPQPSLAHGEGWLQA